MRRTLELIVAATICVFVSLNAFAQNACVDIEKSDQFKGQEIALYSGPNLIGSLQVSRLRMLNDVRKRIQEVTHNIIPIFVCVSEIERAAAFPGDYIVVTTAMINNSIGDNQNIAALIIGHEVAHIVDRHIEYQKEFDRKNELTATHAAANTDLGQGRITWGTAVAWVSSQSKAYSRELEYLADERGLSFAIAAKFDPHSALDFYYQLLQKEDKKDESQSTHPLTANRIAKLKTLYEDQIKRGKAKADTKEQAGDNLKYSSALIPLLTNRNWRVANAFIDEWLKMMPQSGQAWYYKSVVLSRLRPKSNAIVEALEKAVTLDPENQEARFAFCIALNLNDHRIESAWCSRELDEQELGDAHKQQAFNGNLWVGGIPPNAPKGLVVAKDREGKKMITNDSGVAKDRGLQFERSPPWDMLRRPRPWATIQ